MFEIKCPKCGANIKGLVRDYLQWRSDRRKCPSCGVRLEVSNTILCFGLCGLIFGVLAGSSYYWGFGSKWIRLVTALLVCWMVLPVVVRTTGRWHILSTAGTRKLSRPVPVSILALAIAFTITYCVVRITFVVIGK